jgi:uncharacterized protein YkwD
MRKIHFFGTALIFFLITLTTFSLGVYFGRSNFDSPAVFPDGLFVENYKTLAISDAVAYQKEIIPSPIMKSILGAETDESKAGNISDLLSVVNSLRNRHGVGELVSESLLCEKVDQRVSEQTGQGKIDNHAGFERVKSELFAGGFTGVGETLAQGFGSPDQVVFEGWEKSAPHLNILLSGEYTFGCAKLKEGIAVFIGGKK